MKYISLKYSIYEPLENFALSTLIVSYALYLVYNFVLPGYLISGFFTNMSAFLFLNTAAIGFFLNGMIFVLVAAMVYFFIQIGRYNQLRSYTTENRRLFEIQLQQEKEITLASMEALFESIAYEEGGLTWFEEWWKGITHPTFSFEIVSKGGLVHFYVNVPERAREAFLSALHAFFPGVEINEVGEYAFDVNTDEKIHDSYLVQWKFKENNILPIKTYIEYQLEKQSNIGTQESGTFSRQKNLLIDPIAPLFEYLGSIRGNEQIWIQYVFTKEKYPSAPKDYSNNPFDKKYWERVNLKENIEKELQEIDKSKKEAEEKEEIFILKPSQERLKNVGSRILDKSQFEVGVRMIHIAGKGKYDNKIINQLQSIFRLTDTADNKLTSTAIKLKSSIKDITRQSLSSKEFSLSSDLTLNMQMYRDRMFWQTPEGLPYSPPTMIMSSETLATICHFPTHIIQTPTVRRTLSKSIEPPQNLPT